MRSHVPWRRRGVLCALAALLVCGALASPSPAAVRSSVLTAVTGTHSFGALGVYDVTGNASITTMQIPGDPCRLFLPSDPCRVSTIATVLRATNGVTTCSFTGATTQTVAVANTYTVDAVVVPGTPIIPGSPVTPAIRARRWGRSRSATASRSPPPTRSPR